MPRVQTPIQGTKKPKHSPQAIIRRRHRCRRLASSVVLIVTPASAAPIAGAVTIVRSSPTNHRCRPPCGGPPAAPQSAAQAADAGRAACRSISHAHRCPRAPLGQSERDHRRSPQRSCLNLLPSRATPYLAPAAGAIISATTLARARGQRSRLTLMPEYANLREALCWRMTPLLRAMGRSSAPPPRSTLRAAHGSVDHEFQDHLDVHHCALRARSASGAGRIP